MPLEGEMPISRGDAVRGGDAVIGGDSVFVMAGSSALARSTRVLVETVAA